MYEIEPFYNWRGIYTSEDDKKSPFYKRIYNEFHCTNSIYNYAIHPQWDEFGSSTLYLKILYTDYNENFAIIEFLGEWNDCINNDVMLLKRHIIDSLLEKGITKYILIGENILNFHYEEDDYYAEWYEDVEDGWIATINFREHILSEFQTNNVDYYINFGGDLDNLNWRTKGPIKLFEHINKIIQGRLLN